MRQAANRQNSGISIHALHEESDVTEVHHVCGGDISIHALHEESDPGFTDSMKANVLFQSTLSMRRATPGIEPGTHIL